MSFARTGAGNDLPIQQPASDSVVAKTLPRISVTVRDLQDGTLVDSALVMIGTFKGYTNQSGRIDIENVVPSLSVIISKRGYFTLTKKVKSSLQVRLNKKESAAGVATIDNGLYARPVDHFTGSATEVSGDDLRKIHPLNFTEGLRYYDPSFIITDNNNYGYSPNYQPDIRIRGSYNFPPSVTIATSPSNSAAGYQVSPSTGDFIADNISNPNQPIILLDGVQVSLRTAMDIDINRINKVTLLKDAVATAAYGMRGGTGVVLIETKKPQKRNITINYTAQVQFSKADLSSYDLMDASSKLQLEQSAGMYTNNASLYQSRLAQVNKGINTNWLAVPLQTGIGTKHSLTLDGGDDDMMYGLDFSYNNMQGVMKGDKRENISFGGYMGTRFKNLSLTNYLTYVKSTSALSPYGNFRDYAYQNNYWNPYDSVTGEMNKVLEEYVYMNDTVAFYNPAYNGVISTTNETVTSRLANITAFNWILGKGFRLNGQFGISKQSDEQDIFLPPGHTTYAEYTPADFFKRGQYNQNLSNFLSMDGKIQVNYDKKIGLHQFYATGGASAMETRSDATGIALAGFVSDKFSDLAFGNAYSNQRPTSGKIINRLASGFASFTYSYDNRYQLEATGNADASSQFSQSNNIAPHWAVGASWNLHQERFFTPNKILSQFRIRGSVGTSGNLFYQSYLDRTSFDYYTDRQYVIAGSTLGTRGIGLGAYMNGYGNENLKAPETWKANAGFDAVLLQNRLMVRFDVYHQKSTNLVLPIVSPASTGFLNFSYYDNLGGIENKGMDFGVTYNIIRNTTKQIYWSVTVNGVHNQDKITSISDYVAKFNSMGDSMSVDQTRPQPKYVEGKSLTGIWAVRSLGIDPATGQEKFLKADGSTTTTWNAADKVLAGDMTPDLLGSFGSNISYKNISAGLYFNYQFGAEYYNQTLADKIENADLTYNVDARAASNRWSKAGDVALYKPLSLNGMLTSPTYATTRFIEKNNFIRCSAISIGYELPQNIAAKIKAEGINIRFIANNLFTAGTRTDEQGIYYPLSKMYSFTLSTTF